MSSKTYREAINEALLQEMQKDENVVVANYNCPGQVVISGGLEGIEKATQELKEKGADLYASGKSAKARGITKEQLESLGFTPATPNKLVELTFEADRVLIY